MNQQDQRQTNTHILLSLSPLLLLSIPLPPLCCHGNRSRAVSCGSFPSETHKQTQTHTQHRRAYEHTYTPLLMLFDKGLAAVKLIKVVFNLYCVWNTQPKSLCYRHIFLNTFKRPLSTVTINKIFYCTGCQFINSLLYVRKKTLTASVN